MLLISRTLEMWEIKGGGEGGSAAYFTHIGNMGDGGGSGTYFPHTGDMEGG